MQGQGPRPQGPGQGQRLSLQGQGLDSQGQGLHFFTMYKDLQGLSTFCSLLVSTYLQSRNDSKRA